MLCRSKKLKTHGSELLMWTACQICRHLHTISSLLSNILHAFHFRHLPECVALHLGTRIASMRMLGSSWELTRIFNDLLSVDLQIWIRIHVQIIAFLVHRYFEVRSIAPEFVLETATLLVVYVFAKSVSGRHGQVLRSLNPLVKTKMFVLSNVFSSFRCHLEVSLFYFILIEILHLKGA